MHTDSMDTGRPGWTLWNCKALSMTVLAAKHFKSSVAGELCKLARVTGPEFPHPGLLSSRTLPASDWPVPRGAV